MGFCLQLSVRNSSFTYLFKVTERLFIYYYWFLSFIVAVFFCLFAFFCGRREEERVHHFYLFILDDNFSYLVERYGSWSEPPPGGGSGCHTAPFATLPLARSPPGGYWRHRGTSPARRDYHRPMVRGETPLAAKAMGRCPESSLSSAIAFVRDGPAIQTLCAFFSLIFFFRFYSDCFHSVESITHQQHRISVVMVIHEWIVRIISRFSPSEWLLNPALEAKSKKQLK